MWILFILTAAVEVMCICKKTLFTVHYDSAPLNATEEITNEAGRKCPVYVGSSLVFIIVLLLLVFISCVPSLFLFFVVGN